MELVMWMALTMMTATAIMSMLVFWRKNRQIARLKARLKRYER